MYTRWTHPAGLRLTVVLEQTSQGCQIWSWQQSDFSGNLSSTERFIYDSTSESIEGKEEIKDGILVLLDYLDELYNMCGYDGTVYQDATGLSAT